MNTLTLTNIDDETELLRKAKWRNLFLLKCGVSFFGGRTFESQRAALERLNSFLNMARSCGKFEGTDGIVYPFSEINTVIQIPVLP